MVSRRAAAGLGRRFSSTSARPTVIPKIVQEDDHRQCLSRVGDELRRGRSRVRRKHDSIFGWDAPGPLPPLQPLPERVRRPLHERNCGSRAGGRRGEVEDRLDRRVRVGGCRNRRHGVRLLRGTKVREADLRTNRVVHGELRVESGQGREPLRVSLGNRRLPGAGIPRRVARDIASPREVGLRHEQERVRFPDLRLPRRELILPFEMLTRSTAKNASRIASARPAATTILNLQRTRT